MNTQSSKSFSDDENNDLFYFESDHLALKGNKDYSEVLKTIFILESQRARAIKDYDTVVELHKQALNDPLKFIETLKSGENLGIPDLQVIAEVPNIHWSKYKVELPEEGLKFINEKGSHKTNNSNLTDKNHSVQRSKDTHNKHWTTEEQKRLEELLIIYPPEPIEFRRFKKIATALGNRTVKQVTSRVQKYFIKLYKAGLPIPGRIPKYAERTKKSKLHSHQRFNHYLFKPTTFFPQLDIPVTMNESEEVPGPSGNSAKSTSFSNYLIPDPAQPDTEQKIIEEPKSDIDRQLEILRRIKCEKQNENSVQSTFRHFGFRCDYCNEEPIIGTRWHCLSCKAESVDFCSDCVISQMCSGNAHPISHKLEPIKFGDRRASTNIMDIDSLSDSVSGSAFSSSNKNFESSNESDTSDSDGEQCDESQNSVGIVKYEQEDDDDEDNYNNEDDDNDEEENVNNFDAYKTEFKTDVILENDNLQTEFGTDEVNINDNCIKQEVYVLQDESALKKAANESNREYKYHVTDAMLHGNNGILDIEDCNSTEDISTLQCDDQFNSDVFTDTQNISYSYLHSNLLLDNNT